MLNYINKKEQLINMIDKSKEFCVSISTLSDG